jgi:DNA polymerase III subunit beta
MKLVCAQADLDSALNVVGKAISQNTTLPVLNNVLLKAEGGKLNFAGTNLEIAIQCFVDAEIKAEGAITVPAKLLVSYISLLNDESVELVVDEGNNLLIKAASSQTKIKGISAEEFPIIPTVSKDQVFVVSRKSLDVGISQTVFSAATNTARPVLSGILFDLTKDELKLVSTDSYRLAEKKVPLIEPVDFDLQAIVPARTISELGKIVNKSMADNVEITVSKNQILFVVGNTKMVSRLIEGKFPDYEKIIPKTNKTSIVVKTDELSLVVRRVALFARENNNNIKCSVTNDGKLIVSTDETKVGEEKAEIMGVVTGENNKIALNAQYLLDVLNFIQSDEITIDLDDKLSPAVIRITKESTQTYMYIIMPLKV